MGPVYGEGEHGCRRHGGPPTRSHKGDVAIDRVQAGEGEARASASRGFPKGGEGEHEPEGLGRRCDTRDLCPDCQKAERAAI